ncbi:DUF4145 domain-containing protein [Pseudomonas chlororaphis]|uniref:DUF4145 domain-containing protein n=1 Tax=Pseudomonas chlororaphis TaxID=587753 RepID=UPI000F6C714C|nr:DUF4145 domain-containing protein [Pseudomonas chlororaphis]AZC94217.1 hypothetical protein C4K28_1474 [Pseudomonas chlororaphis subsp. piscium]
MAGENLIKIGNVLRSDCRGCNNNTRHEVMGVATERIQEWHTNELNSWCVVRCLGCHTYSFQHKHEDFDQIEEDFEGELHHEVIVNVYPSVIRNHRPLTATYLLPRLISSIYLQTLKALSQNSNTLGSIGLRACIEAVCNHLEISGNNLQRRIDSLFKAGHVSNGDKKRLHAIRFLGNDAAHEIKQPSITDIRVALEIVEHLLNAVFILESKAKGLETTVETYPEFIALLELCASKHKNGLSINLIGLLGRQKRLVAVNLETTEAQLIDDIDSGHIPFLAKASLQTDNGKSIQFYDVVADYFKKDEEFSDDIPF